MRRSNRIAARQFSLADVVSVARDPLMQALCKDGQNISAEGLATTISLAQTGVLGISEQANLILADFWPCLLAPNKLPPMTAANSLEEIYSACEEAGIEFTAESTKEHLLSRLPASVPPSLYKLMKDFNLEKRKAATRAIIPELNAQYDTSKIPMKDWNIYSSPYQAKVEPFKLPTEMLHGLTYREARGAWAGGPIERRRYLTTSVAELALVYHGDTLSESTKAAIMRKRDFAVERLERQEQKQQQKLEKKEVIKGEARQRLEDLRGYFEDNGLGTLPSSKGAFTRRGMQVTGAHVFGWKGKEITQERALEAMKEAAFYKQHVGDRNSGHEKFRRSDYKPRQQPDGAVRSGKAGRGRESLKMILTKGVEACRELPDIPEELTATIQRYEQVLGLGVTFPAAADYYSLLRNFNVSGRYITEEPYYRGGVPSFETTCKTVEEALWYVEHTDCPYEESTHLAARWNYGSLDNCLAHTQAAAEYVREHNNAEGNSGNGSSSPQLVQKLAAEAVAAAYVAEVGSAAAYKALQLSPQTDDETLPLVIFPGIPTKAAFLEYLEEIYDEVEDDEGAEGQGQGEEGGEGAKAERVGVLWEQWQNRDRAVE